MVVLTVALGTYVSGLFHAGVWLGNRARQGFPIWQGIAVVGLGWAPITMAALSLPLAPPLKAAAVAVLYLLHAPPMAIGYWGGRTASRDESEKRWSKNVDDWLGDWECRPTQEQHDEST